MAAPADRYLTLDAIRAIRAAISQADHNEVFFVGRVGPDGRVGEVEVAARGQRHAVLAISRKVRAGDVVIHNHPSGNLTPSDPDMAIAGRLADEEVGFFIVDDQATRVYAVVEAFLPSDEPEPVDPGAMERLFREVLGEVMDGFEFREAQVRMAETVAAAFRDHAIAMVEAGTGTGKTLGYLVPAAMWAIANDERVVVATGTINLQEQLLTKDLPILQDLMERAGLGAPRVSLVKGRGNYLCLRRLARASMDKATLFPGEHDRILEDIEAWAETTGDGTRQDLSFTPPQEVWEEISCDADSCSGVACRYHGDCFLMKARREAARSHVVVVNHHLFFADAALRAAQEGAGAASVLPRFTKAVLDEAHKVEDAASSFFGGLVSRRALWSTLSRLVRSRRSGRGPRGLLPSAAARLAREYPGRAMEVRETMIPEVGQVKDAVEGFFQLVEDWVDQELESPGPKAEVVYRVTPGVVAGDGWAVVREEAAGLRVALESLAGRLQGLVSSMDSAPQQDRDDGLDGLVSELRAVVRRVRGAGSRLAEFFAAPREGDDGMVRWVELRRRARGTSVVLHMVPVEVREPLKDAVFDRLTGCILTSATLTTAGPDGFWYLVSRLGLDLQPRERLRARVLPSPFDFQRQAMVLVARDLPAPGSGDFPSACARVVLDAVAASRGGAFVLFTSYGLLRMVFDMASPELLAMGTLPMRQGELPRNALLERFRRSGNGVLFGTDSFWEGVDVRGDALRSVIIVKLPFRVPTEPLVEARVEAIEARGGNPFQELSLPQALIRFRQGFGRLVRSRSDRGIVLILDHRVVTRRYGKMFLDGLPGGVPVRVGVARDLIRAMGEFFQAHGHR